MNEKHFIYVRQINGTSLYEALKDGRWEQLSADGLQKLLGSQQVVHLNPRFRAVRAW
jgi:hypothetical protein